MPAEYEPGTVAVATVRGVEGVRVISCGKNGYHDFWWSPEYVIEWRQHEDRDVTDVRPLVVLDLDGHSPAVLADQLAREGFADLADQIEAQTKPPRIPEPGLWGVVEATFSKDERLVRKWVRYGTGWRDAFGKHCEWDELIDPALIRKGVES